MTKDEELEELRKETTVLREVLLRKDEELEQSHQANRDLREGLKQAIEEKQCPVCWHLTRAPFPAEVRAPAQYGTSIQALAVSLLEGQCVPYARASQLLRDLLGMRLSAGSIARFVQTCHQQVAEVEKELKAALVKARVLNQDETGLRVGKAGWWIHVSSTDRLTHSAAHRSRGREALNAIGIAPQFRGKSRHDGLASYQGYSCTQALVSCASLAGADLCRRRTQAVLGAQDERPAAGHESRG